MAKFSSLYLCLLIFVFFTSCRDSIENKYVIKSKWAKNANTFTIKIDSIRIPLEKNLAQSYYTYAAYSDGRSDYFFGYNSTTSSIDIFNLNTRTFFKRLDLAKDNLFFKNLDKQDLDKSRSITDINVINFDSILINHGNQNILIVDTSLKKKKVIALNILSAKNGILGNTISYSNNFRMLFFKGSLVLNQIYPNYNWKKRMPTFALLDISSEKLDFLPISYSDFLFDMKGNVGYLSAIETSQHQKEGVLTYSYPYESNIYQYNPYNNTITAFGAAMSKGKNLADSISYKSDEDLKKWDRHLVENSQFFNVIYDKYRRVYYRFSLKDISNENGKYFNSILDKPLILMVFNEKFEVLKELELPKYLYSPNTWFVNEEGLFISPSNKKNKVKDPTHLRFHIIKIQKNN